VRKSILSAIAALSLCLCMPATAQTLMRTTPRQSAKIARIKLSEDHIKEVQRALEAKGYDVGEVDGELGSKTERALRKFQKAQRLPVTGQIDRATLARLRDQIRAAQRALRRKGYDIKTIDGTFGEKTERELRKFQKARHLPVTGLLDDKSLNALQIGKRGAAGRGAPARAKRPQER
jgi:peptidoglycan hydrolase-like protein with peptidoglycan-binding domain